MLHRIHSTVLHTHTYIRNTQTCVSGEAEKMVKGGTTVSGAT